MPIQKQKDINPLSLSSTLHPAPRKAFSLIEVAIAIGILALVFGGMLAVFDRGAIAARKTQQQAAAYNLARALLEEYSDWGRLIALTGSNPPANETYTNPPNLIFSPPILLNNITYTPQMAISDGPINPAQLKRLEITISWTDGAIARSITIATLKADY